MLKTVFTDAKFKDCKLLGIRFDDCSTFGLSVSFDNCSVKHASFFKTKIRNTVFNNSQLHEADFTEADLTNAVFNNCDLLDARFEMTILEKADFRSSFNYLIDPEKNKIKKARFSLEQVVGLLSKYDIVVE